MERQDYPAMVPQLAPGHAVDILNDRVREVGRLNIAIADWLQERRRLEEQYSAGLRRLARRSLEGVDLGIFSVPWSAITNSADTLAEAHSALVTRIEVDVERPLREFVGSNRDMQGMSTVQGNLLSLAKDVEKAQAKVEKLRDRNTDATRITDAERELGNAQAQWESQAPYVFANLQAIDEARLLHLRDVLTQFQTHEADQVEKIRGSAEQCLNILLQVETEDEIKTFVLKALSSTPSQVRSRRLSLASPAQQNSSNNLTPIRSQQDDASIRPGSTHDEKDKRKSRFGGLKRLGTVVGGKRDGKKRESKMPSGLATMSETPERPSRSPFNSFSGRFGKNKEGSSLDLSQDAEATSSSAQRPASPLRIGSEVLEPALSTNGDVAPPRLMGRIGEADANGPVISPPTGHQSDLADLDPPKPISVAPGQGAVAGGVDQQGYSIPPQIIDPITQAQQEADAFGGEPSSQPFNLSIRASPNLEQNSLEAQAALASVAGKLSAPPVVSRANTVRGRRGARNSAATSTYFPPDQALSIPELVDAPTGDPIASSTPPAAISAIEQPPVNGETSAKEIAPAPTVSPPLATGAFVAPTISPEPTGPVVAALPSQTLGRAPMTPDLTGDNGSIRSGASTTSQLTRHGVMSEVGLNSSIVETINARFVNGSITAASLIGEVALAYTPPDFSSPFGNENVMLKNFSNLDKVAPNPAFITQSSQNEGEYVVRLAGISRPQIAFKYQSRLSNPASCAPLMITPAFKTEAKQTSVIVSYGLNPAFDVAGQDRVTLSNVVLGLTLEGATASACQSRPVGTFSREKSLIFWQLGDLILESGKAPEKLLARFATESTSTGGSVDARWEITGAKAQALGSGLVVSVQNHASGHDGADPFADEDAALGGSHAWKATVGSRKLVSGNYTAR